MKAVVLEKLVSKLGCVVTVNSSRYSGTCDNIGVTAVVTGDDGEELWRGTTRYVNSPTGMTTVANELKSGTVVSYDGKPSLQAVRAAAQKEADAALTRLAAESPKVTAIYRGEWMVQDYAFVADADGKKYAWIVSREVPAMSYSADGGEFFTGPATWLEDGKATVFKPSKISESRKTIPEGGLTHYIHVRPKSTAAKLDLLGMKPGELSSGSLMDNMDGVQKLTFAANIVLAVGYCAWAGYSGYKKYKKYAADKAAASAAAAAPKVEVARPGAAPMPGWPAINFRGGKKAKAKATKKSESEYTIKLELEQNHRASFDLDDGAIVELKSAAISATVLDDEGVIVWSTSQLHIPIDPPKNLLVPLEVQAIVYAGALANEAQAYIAFLESEPDMTVEVSS
jgi:hypothetical protein